MDNEERSDRRPVGKEGAGAHQEGPNSVQAGQTQRREFNSSEGAEDGPFHEAREQAVDGRGFTERQQGIRRRGAMNSQSKPDVKDVSNEDAENTSLGIPDVPRNDETRSGEADGVADQEPGPFDDDGLPENARRRVPS